MVFKRAWIGILLILVLSLTLPSPSAGQQAVDSGWTPPKLLGGGWWQSVAIDQEGRLHVGWFGGVEVNDGGMHDALMYAVREPDGTWKPTNDAIYTGDGGYTVRNALAVTSDGILHAVFRAVTRHQYARAPARAADSAANWTTPIEMNSFGYYVDMTKDRNDVLHLMYSGGQGIISRGGTITMAELSPCAFCNDMFYRRSTDGGRTWSSDVPISFEAESGSDRMDIFEGLSGRLYTVWDEGLDWYQGRGTALDVRIIYSEDGGLSWSDKIILDGGGHADRRPIQIGAVEMLDGALMVVWRYSTDIDRNIYYQITDDLGQTWTPPQPIPGFVARSINDSPLDDYELLLDRLGTVWLFATGQPNLQRQANAGLYAVQYRNGSWLTPQRLFYSPEYRPEWPKAALGINNDIHLTFFLRGWKEYVTTYQDATADLTVYYTYYPGNLPSTAVAFNPTQTPRPTPTIVQELRPTQTPFMLQEPMEQPPGLVTADTYAAQTILGGTIAVGVLCAFILSLVQFIIRRR